MSDLIHGDASAVIAALGGHHHGQRIFLPIVVFIIFVIGVVLLVQRRRNRRPLDEAMVASRFQGNQGVETMGSQVMAAVATGALDKSPLVSRHGSTAQSATRTAGRLPPGRYSMRGLLASEWTKLRTVRSTMWTIGITIALGVGLSAIASAETAAHWSTMSIGDKVTFDPTQTSLIGVAFGQLVIGILGVLVMSAEYGTGTIRATLSAAPKRPKVLIAKATIFGLVALVVSEVVSFIAFFLGQALLTAPATHATLSSPEALRQVVGAGLYLFVLGLFALGLATIIRHTAGAISAFVGTLLVLPLIVEALPESLARDIRRFLPANIGNSITSAHPGRFVFSPWTGLAVLSCYAAAALIVGGVLFVRRDA